TQSVFRYADSSFALVSIRMSNCPTFAVPSRYDSLWFSNDSGLYRRQWARCEDNDWYGWAAWNTMRLLSRTTVSVEEDPSFPSTLRLFQNFPNPFNPTTVIVYNLPKREKVLLAVYDLLGRQVVVLSEGVQEQGRHQHTFDGSRLVSGVYFVRLQTQKAVRSNKIILLR
ncbi:MAG: 5'-Nucleotidase domain protein, partial [Bacteroidetes bacterium]|nr:5'-Nucleotidase domain protein [Bacteroidota bacterium]